MFRPHPRGTLRPANPDPRWNNWTFAGFVAFGRRDAAIHTQIEMCEVNEVALRPWLADVFERQPLSADQIREVVFRGPLSQKTIDRRKEDFHAAIEAWQPRPGGNWRRACLRS